jgi:hypothetical protein
MVSFSAPQDAAIADAYDGSEFKHIVDVAGGRGGLLSLLLSRNQNATDRPTEAPGPPGSAQCGISRATLFPKPGAAAERYSGATDDNKCTVHNETVELCATGPLPRPPPAR